MSIQTFYDISFHENLKRKVVLDRYMLCTCYVPFRDIVVCTLYFGLKIAAPDLQKKSTNERVIVKLPLG